eukprot:3524213-Rhodomonas_salina.1
MAVISATSSFCGPTKRYLSTAQHIAQKREPNTAQHTGKHHHRTAADRTIRSVGAGYGIERCRPVLALRTSAPGIAWRTRGTMGGMLPVGNAIDVSPETTIRSVSPALIPCSLLPCSLANSLTRSLAPPSPFPPCHVLSVSDSPHRRSTA